MIADVAAAALAAILASLLRLHVEAVPSTTSYSLLGALVVLTWPAFLASASAYELRTSLFGVEELRRVLRAGVSLFAILGIAALVFRLDLSRGYVAVIVPAVVLLTGASRVSLRSSNLRRQRQGHGLHRVVAVGPVHELRHLVLRLQSQRRTLIDVVAFVADDLEPDAEVPAPLDRSVRLPDQNAIRNLTEHGLAVDLLVRAGRPGADEMAALGKQAHDLGLTVAIAPRQHDTTANMSLSYLPLGATPLLVVETPTLKPASAALKTVLDKVVALTALLILSPLLLATAAVIAIRDGRGVVFHQERVGRDGRTFGCLKFRTMCSDAEAQLDGLRSRNEACGPLFKLHDDPRVTRTGRWLRFHSIDELPQLWNVLRGEMSIVGPRPPLPCEVETYDERTARRLLVKPGLTGLWQVEGRSDLAWDDGVYLDLMYVDHWSPLLDLVIIARTAKTLIRPSGAY